MVHQAHATAAPQSRTNRARTTNDPRYVRGADGRSAPERRRRDLIAIYLDALGGRTAVSELQLVAIRRAAELTVATETLRATVLAGNTTAEVGALVRLEGEARRAVRALGIKPGGNSKPQSLKQYLASRPTKPVGETSESGA